MAGGIVHVDVPGLDGLNVQKALTHRRRTTNHIHRLGWITGLKGCQSIQIVLEDLVI